MSTTAACHTSNKLIIIKKIKLIESVWNPNSNENILATSMKSPTPLDLANLVNGESSKLKYPSKLVAVRAKAKIVNGPKFPPNENMLVNTIVTIAVNYRLVSVPTASSFQSDVSLFAKSGFWFHICGISISDTFVFCECLSDC